MVLETVVTFGVNHLLIPAWARPGPKLKALSLQRLGSDPVDGLGAPRRTLISVLRIIVLLSESCCGGKREVASWTLPLMALTKEDS